MRTYPAEPDELTFAADAQATGFTAAARAALEGRRHGWRAALPFLGPAFIASVAYIDPGNFATNIQGGSFAGYDLLWVVLLANVMATLVQALSAKLGIATGLNLAEVCRERLPKGTVYALWAASEVAAMATDLAEFLGASLGLNLLFHVPLLPATLLTGAATYAILLLEQRGMRRLEAIIAALIGVVALSYIAETLLSRPDWGQVVWHSVTPSLPAGTILLAVGIVGATIMPHVIYLHSSLTQRRVVPRSEREARRLFRLSLPDVALAMGLAGLINMAMLYMAAATFHARGLSGIADITTAYRTLTPLLGAGAGTIFAISLLASGLSSSTVGTMAGQVIMQGFVGYTIPLWVRRVVTMAPAVIVAGLGINATMTLVISQVILSLILPAPVIALAYFTSRRDVMGTLVNRPLVTVGMIVCAAIILTLNLILITQVIGTL